MTPIFTSMTALPPCPPADAGTLLGVFPGVVSVDGRLDLLFLEFGKRRLFLPVTDGDGGEVTFAALPGRVLHDQQAVEAQGEDGERRPLAAGQAGAVGDVDPEEVLHEPAGAVPGPEDEGEEPVVAWCPPQ